MHPGEGYYSRQLEKILNKPVSNIQKELLALSIRDPKAAKKMLRENQDRAFNIAYNATLQAVKALMYSKGFRPSGISQHAAIIEFAGITLENKYSEIIEIMDTMYAVYLCFILRRN